MNRKPKQESGDKEMNQINAELEKYVDTQVYLQRHGKPYDDLETQRQYIMPIQKENKGDYREIKEVKLYEISAVTLAANDQAKILDVKGNIDVEKLSKRYDNLSKLIRKGSISDEMGFAIEAEILKLKSLFVEFTKPVDEITSPKVEAKNNDSEVLNYLLNSLKN